MAKRALCHTPKSLVNFLVLLHQKYWVLKKGICWKITNHQSFDRMHALYSEKMKMQACMAAAYSHKHDETRQVNSQKAGKLRDDEIFRT